MHDVKHAGKGDVRVARADRPAGGGGRGVGG